jgi:hypothetical protein
MSGAKTGCGAFEKKASIVSYVVVRGHTERESFDYVLSLFTVFHRRLKGFP